MAKRFTHTTLKFLLGAALPLFLALLLNTAEGKAAEQATSRQAKAASGPCTSQEANQFWQRGRNVFAATGYETPEIVAAASRALTYFELAAEKDPGCAQAYLSLAQAEAEFPSWPGLPPKERFEKMKVAAKKAIALQEDLAAAHTLLGVAEFNTWQWAQAEKEFKRAIALAPNDVRAHTSYARFLAALGHFDQAIVQIEEARKLANGSPGLNVAAGEINYWARHYDQAIDLIRPNLGADPIAYFLLGWAYAGKSRWQEAIGAFEKALPPSERDAGVLMSLAYADAAAGRRGEIPKLVEEAKEKTTRMYVPIYRIAAVYVALGDKEQALEWLEKSYQDDFSWMVWLKVDPVMDPLRSDPRFQNLLRRMNFPQ